MTMKMLQNMFLNALKLNKYDTYPFAKKFVLEYFKSQELCDKDLDTCPFAFDSVPD